MTRVFVHISAATAEDAIDRLVDEHGEPVRVVMYQPEGGKRVYGCAEVKLRDPEPRP